MAVRVLQWVQWEARALYNQEARSYRSGLSFLPSADPHPQRQMEGRLGSTTTANSSHDHYDVSHDLALLGQMGLKKRISSRRLDTTRGSTRLARSPRVQWRNKKASWVSTWGNAPHTS